MIEEKKVLYARCDGCQCTYRHDSYDNSDDIYYNINEKKDFLEDLEEIGWLQKDGVLMCYGCRSENEVAA